MKIADLSHHQGAIDWEKASKELELAIIRVQYGSSAIDRMYKEYVEGCKKYKVPFGHYAYARFVSVNDAAVEARDFLNRIDKDAVFLVVDVEEMTVRNTADLVPATQKFIDTCKAAGYKTGLYSGESFYNANGLSKVKADFLWIAKYSNTKPNIACDLWQYTSTGSVSGIVGNVDLNVLNNPIFKKEETGVGAKSPTMYRLVKGNDVQDTAIPVNLYNKLNDGYRVEAVPDNAMSSDMFRLVDAKGNLQDTGDIAKVNTLIKSGYLMVFHS